MSSSSSSLSTVVSGLVRAQMGSSLSPTVTDEDLDKAVAELILKEAKKKAEAYQATGLKAYLRNNFFDSNAPRANKRFLSNIIKNTDDHNKTVIRAQAEAAFQVKRSRDDSERSERRRRAEEAADAEHDRRRSHRSSRKDSRSHRRSRRHRDPEREAEKDVGKGKGKARANDSDEEHILGLSWDRWDGRTASRKRKVRDWEAWDGSESDSSSGEESSSRSASYSRRHARKLSRSHSSNARSDSPGLEDGSSLRARKAHSSHRRHRDRHRRSRSPSAWTRRLRAAAAHVHSTSHSENSSSSNRRTPSLGPEALPYVPSKMDRYFDADYDPRLDVGHIEMPIIPSTGLISDAEFAGWDAMLDALRAREDRKRARAAGLPVSDTASRAGSSSQAGLMDMKYAKRGSTREWDMGKETPT